MRERVVTDRLTDMIDRYNYGEHVLFQIIMTYQLALRDAGWIVEIKTVKNGRFELKLHRRASS